jgi:hypothetical protein
MRRVLQAYRQLNGGATFGMLRRFTTRAAMDGAEKASPRMTKGAPIRLFHRFRAHGRRPEVRGWAFTEPSAISHDKYHFFVLRLIAIPINPPPTRSIVAGSGVGSGVSGPPGGSFGGNF